MVQYTQCADPTKSVAHRERICRAEKEGQLEETTAHMVQASLGDKPEEFQLMEEIPSAIRRPITLRLGPMAPLLSLRDQKKTGTSEKHKLGRTPGHRKIQTSSKLIRGSISRKRKTQQTKTTQTRRQPNPDFSLAKKTKVRAGASRDSSAKSTSITNSEDQPICNMIPAATRRRMKF